MTPNPSLERTATGLALGPLPGVVHHPSSGPSAIPASARSAQTLGRIEPHANGRNTPPSNSLHRLDAVRNDRAPYDVDLNPLTSRQPMTTRVQVQVATLASFTTIVVAYLFSPLLPPPKSPAADVLGLLINFASALGTFIAALVALHLGANAQQRMALTDHARASVAAAKLVHRLERIGHRLDWTIQAALYKSSHRGAYRYLLMGVRGEDLSDEALHFSDDELIALLPLEHDCAARIAMCTTELLRLRRSVEHYEQLFDLLSSDDEKSSLVKQWMDGIRAVSLQLAGVHEVLSAASGRIALKPPINAA